MQAYRHPLAGPIFFDRFNPNHDPDTGQFTSGDGDGGGNGGTNDLYSDLGAKTGDTSQHAEKTGKTGSGSGSGGKGGGKGPAATGASPEKPSRPYEGRSPRNDQGVRRLNGATIRRIFAPSADHTSALKESGATPLTFNELDHSSGSATTFHTLIGEAKQASKYGAAITLYPLDDYKTTRLFVTDDGMAGFALKGDDIISVFKHPDSTDANVVASVLTLAKQEGGRRLDCFDTVLPELYSAQGFRAVARTPFDENYQPEGWDKKTFAKFNGGKPDVVFMIADPAAKLYERGDGKSYPSYDDAMAAQVAAVAETKPDRKRAFAGPGEACAYELFFLGSDSRFNPNHDPDNGQFTYGPGGEGGDVGVKPTEALPAPEDHKLLSPPAEPVLHPKALDVGASDQWSRDTARRLESEYQRAKPVLETIVDKGLGEEHEGVEDIDEDAPYVPEEWDMLSGDQQEAAKEAYINQNLESWIDNEISYWHESGNALDEAKASVAQGFNDLDGTEDWARDALQEYLDEREEEGHPVPYTLDQLMAAVALTYHDGHEGKGDLDVDFDDDKLKAPSNAPPPEQMTFPGIEEADLSTHLTEGMRDEITKLISDAFDKEASDKEDHLEAPDYIADSAKEQLEEDWDHNLDDEYKWKWVKDNTDFVSDAEKAQQEYYDEHSHGGGEVAHPASFKVDPLQQNSSIGAYKKTQTLASYLSIERQMQLIEDRDLKSRREDVRRVDQQLWESWKGSSTSFGGQILQLATADELGTRFRDLPTHRDDLIAQANDKYKAIGGYAGVKALVRAKWETTQYLLDKADVHAVEVYRGMKMDLPKDERIESVKDRSGLTDRTYQRIPDARLLRNGAWSTTTDRGVANRWNGGIGNNKVVLRIQAPRTSVLSIPAYGINVHGEHEVVLAGGAYKHWDAWKGDAPHFDEVPVETPTKAEQTKTEPKMVAAE